MTPTNDDAAIRNLIASYAHAADDGDGDGLAMLFTPEGAIESLGLRIAGADRLASLIKGIYDANLKHLQLNSVVRIDGDATTATAVSDLHVQSAAVPEAGWQTVAHGRYHDQLVRVDGTWRFTTREILWHRATPGAVLDQLRGLMAAGA